MKSLWHRFQIITSLRWYNIPSLNFYNFAAKKLIQITKCIVHFDSSINSDKFTVCHILSLILFSTKRHMVELSMSAHFLTAHFSLLNKYVILSSSFAKHFGFSITSQTLWWKCVMFNLFRQIRHLDAKFINKLAWLIS